MNKLALLVTLLALGAAPARAENPATNAVVKIPMEAFAKDADWKPFVPAGFTISPSDAHYELGHAWMLSLKHVFVCYADDRYYYFGDAFNREPPRERVLRSNRKVDGRTGEIPDRPPFFRIQKNEDFASYLFGISTNDRLSAAVVVKNDCRTELSKELFPELISAFTNVQATAKTPIPRQAENWTLELLGPNPSGLTERIPYYRLYCTGSTNTEEVLVFSHPVTRMTKIFDKPVLIPCLKRFFTESIAATNAPTAPAPHADSADGAKEPAP